MSRASKPFNRRVLFFLRVRCTEKHCAHDCPYLNQTWLGERVCNAGMGCGVPAKHLKCNPRGGGVVFRSKACLDGERLAKEMKR